MVELHEVRYQMDLGCNRDTWKLHGRVVNHPNFEDWQEIFVSTPQSLDISNLVITTTSGRKYKLMSFSAPQASVIEQIQKDIENNGYEVH